MDDAGNKLMAALLQGINLGATPDSALASHAARIRGFERVGYLYGAREIPLPALLARQVSDLGGQSLTAEALSASLTVLLGVRESDPKKVRFASISERALDALVSMRALVDGELFFHQEGMRGQLRVLPVESSAPEAVFEAWEVGESSWGREGALRVEPRLAEETTEGVHLEYDLERVARWSQPRLTQAMPGEPFQLGCERVWLQVLALAPEREGTPAHPLWHQAVEQGYTTSEKAVLLLVLMPNLSLVANLLGGPAANNVFGENIEAVYQSAHTGYSAWSEVVAKKLLDEWYAEKGSLTGLDTPHGVIQLVCEALPAFVEGRAVASDEESSAQRSFGFAVGEWVGSLFTPDQESGAGLVRDIIRKRDQGEPVTLETRISGNSMHLAALALEPNGAIQGERAFK